MSAPIKGHAVVAMLVRTGVNYGDHAQDNWSAIEVKPGETVTEFANRALSVTDWGTLAESRFDDRIELRLVRPSDGGDDLL